MPSSSAPVHRGGQRMRIGARGGWFGVSEPRTGALEAAGVAVGKEDDKTSV